MTEDRDLEALESVDDRMIGLMRLVLASSALLITYIDPSEPSRLVGITYATLIGYTIYSAVLYILSVRHNSLFINGIAHWIDVGCYLIVIALSMGTSSIFFFFFFFAILVASFRWGFMSGFRVTLASVTLFIVIGYVTAPAGPNFELNRFLLRPIYLLVLGYMVAYWGGCEIRLRRRLRLLKEITRLSNPRFGVSFVIGTMSKKVQEFYGADFCLILLTDPLDNQARMFRSDNSQPAESVRAEPIPPQLEQMLLSLPENLAVVYNGKSRLHSAGDYAFDLAEKRERTDEWRRAVKSLASKMGTESFISVPLQYRGKSLGRLYLSARKGIFTFSDVDFLMQLIEQIMPVIHNIRLLSRLASNSAEMERQRLARDIHDSVIQPYIGLQYKLAAVRNKLTTGGDVSGDVERLFQMTVDEVNGLRGFVRGLKDNSGRQGDLLSAVKRFAAQFGENYELDVRVESRGEINVNDRLAAELIKIVHEGLSNVRKHTDASGCRIRMERAASSLRLSIENNGETERTTPVCFTPVSITERAEELGGSVRVEQTGEGHTAVRIEIPL